MSLLLHSRRLKTKPKKSENFDFEAKYIKGAGEEICSAKGK